MWFYHISDPVDAQLRKEKLLKRYQDRFVFEEKTTEELLQWLAETVGYEPLPLTVLTEERPRVFAALRQNILKLTGLTEDVLQFELLRIPRSGKSAPYYTERTEEEILLLLERTTGIIQNGSGTGNGKLELAWKIQQGISREDYEAQNQKYDVYLSALHLFYDDGEWEWNTQQ